MLDGGKRKAELSTWLDDALPAWFEHRLLRITAAVADRWGYLLAHSERTLPAIDSLLAATALAFNLKMVTRNVADFTVPGLVVINPWE